MLIPYFRSKLSGLLIDSDVAASLPSSIYSVEVRHSISASLLSERGVEFCQRLFFFTFIEMIMRFLLLSLSAVYWLHILNHCITHLKKNQLVMAYVFFKV